MIYHPSFKFILVYEDRAAGIRAKEMSDRLAAMLEPECHVSNEAWNFALLSDPQLREVAAEDARQAHMVIISAQSIKALPGHIKTWLEEWLPKRKAGKAALVVLLGGHEHNEMITEYAMMQDDLKILTSISQMDFFCGFSTQHPMPGNVIKLPALTPKELEMCGAV